MRFQYGVQGDGIPSRRVLGLRGALGGINRTDSRLVAETGER
jgi:hypothetical protein